MLRTIERLHAVWRLENADGYRLGCIDGCTAFGVNPCRGDSTWRLLPGWVPNKLDELFVYDEEG